MTPSANLQQKGLPLLHFLLLLTSLIKDFTDDLLPFFLQCICLVTPVWVRVHFWLLINESWSSPLSSVRVLTPVTSLLYHITFPSSLNFLKNACTFNWLFILILIFLCSSSRGIYEVSLYSITYYTSFAQCLWRF